MQQDQSVATGEVTRRSLIRLGIMVAICFFFSSLMPAGLVMATFSSLLMLGALVTALFAALTREPVWPDYVTRWDQSSVLFALGLIAGWTVDPQAASDALVRLEQAQSPGS